MDLFRELLWAEAARIGIGINKINISYHVDVADGGIDASIRDVKDSFDSGLIKAGLNCYQIKAGGSFIPWQEFHIKKELFANKTPGKENLGNSIKNCFDNQSTYPSARGPSMLRSSVVLVFIRFRVRVRRLDVTLTLRRTKTIATDGASI